MLADVPQKSEVTQEETFGPVVALSTFDGTDEQAVAWVLGLSALLHALGRLDRPLSPSALLWLRARMKLRVLAANERRSAPAQLARVVRQASASRLREG